MKNLKFLIENGDRIDLKKADFSSKRFGRKLKRLKKYIQKLEKSYAVDYEDLKNIVFKPLIKD